MQALSKDENSRLDKGRRAVHVCIETLHPWLNPKSTLKQCLLSDSQQAADLQAAAKVSLLCSKSDNVFKAFEFTLQSIIKQPSAISPLQAGHVFRAYCFYLHCTVGERTASSSCRQQLTERLIACWQDLKFSFLQLEKLIIKEKDPVIFQVLVLTLFCPNGRQDVDLAPVLDHTDGPKLVDLFTPEFCLKIGDTFVNSIRDDGEDGGSGVGPQKAVVSRWLERQRSTDTSLAADPEDDTLSKNLNDLVTGLLDPADALSIAGCNTDS